MADNRIKSLKHQEMLQFWSKHIQACRNSDGNVKKYCREHGLTKTSYYYWQKQLFEAISNEVESTSVKSETELGLTSLEITGHTHAASIKPAVLSECNAACTSNAEFVEVKLPSIELKGHISKVPNEPVPAIQETAVAAKLTIGDTSVDIYNTIKPELLQIIMRGLR